MNSNRKNLTNGNAGFTIVELLLVVAIIGVLTTLALGVLQGATNDAKVAATKARILQVETILAIEMEDYEVRRLPISVGVLAAYATPSANSIREDGSGNAIKVLSQVRNLRRRIMLDLLSAEMPRPIVSSDDNGTDDPLDDFDLNPDVGVFPTNEPGVGTGALGFRDWLDQEYSAPVGGMLLSTRLAGLRSAKTQIMGRLAGNVNFNLPGEYLHAVLSTIDIDGERGVDLLPNNAIGDFDQDGIPEVVDAWGEPMALVIFQVETDKATPPSDDTAVGADIYQDRDDDPSLAGPQVSYTFGGQAQMSRGPNFELLDEATGLPVGYTVLNPTVPRELGKIKFEVLSSRMGRNRD